MPKMRKTKAWRKNTTNFKTIGVTARKTKWTAPMTTWLRRWPIHSQVPDVVGVGRFGALVEDVVVVVVDVVVNASGCQADAARRLTNLYGGKFLQGTARVRDRTLEPESVK